MESKGYEIFRFQDIVAQGGAIARCGMILPENIGEVDAEILHEAFMLFSEYEKTHPVPAANLRTFALIAFADGHFDMTLSESAIGESTTLALIDLHRLHRQKSPITRVAVVLEELCHGIYMVPDEHDVKRLVIQMINQKYPLHRLHHLYPKMFLPTGESIDPNTGALLSSS
ncbi:MAG: hypothetical protein IJ188_03135 [Clostridia bacterium]|nr:hypothetical protein [Clostridia bacterium]